jgi:hypothetical protein
MIDRLFHRWTGPLGPVHARACLAILVGAVAVGGCRRAVTSTSAEQAAVPALDIVLKTPEDATRGLLDTLRAQLQATARGDRAAARRYRDQVVERVAARDQIMARYRALPGHVPQAEAEVLNTLMENWASILSYYANGLALSEMKRSVVGSEGGGAVVDVPAHGPDDRAILRVACVRGPDDEWRILAIGLEPGLMPTLATQPAAASQPTSNPAPRSPA